MTARPTVADFGIGETVIIDISRPATCHRGVVVGAACVTVKNGFTGADDVLRLVMVELARPIRDKDSDTYVSILAAHPECLTHESLAKGAR